MLFVGSGAVNLCLAGWIHSGTSLMQFLVRRPDNPLIASGSFQCLLPGNPNKRLYQCEAFATLEGVSKPDLIVVGVKNYSLQNLLGKIEGAFGKDVPILSVLNGVSHVQMISERFSDALFATIVFNAYRTSPTEAIAVGNSIGLSAANSSSPMLGRLQRVLEKKATITMVNNPLDAAHCKLIINLGNALLTIVAFHENRTRELNILQKITAELMNEGVDVLKQVGVKEAKISGMPPWFLIRLTKLLPQWVILPIFEKKLKANSINSMAQDVSAGSDQTELEYLNGYLLQLADKMGLEVPYNRALYNIFKDWITNGDQPLTPSELLSNINSFSNR